jgi:hypothetical protein
VRAPIVNIEANVFFAGAFCSLVVLCGGQFRPQRKSGGDAELLILKEFGGESGIVFRPISEITPTMEKSLYPFVIADTFRIAAMKFDSS